MNANHLLRSVVVTSFAVLAAACSTSTRSVAPATPSYIDARLDTSRSFERGSSRPTGPLDGRVARR